MKPVWIEYEVKPRDMVAVSLFQHRMVGATRKMKLTYAVVGVILVLTGSGGFVAAVLYPKLFLGSLPYSILSWAVGVGCLVVAVLAVPHLRVAFTRHYTAPHVRRFLGRCSFAVTDEGFVVCSPGGTYSHPWPAVVAVAVTAEYAFVTAALLTYPVPRRAFPDDAAFDTFVTAVREGIERYGSVSGDGSAVG
ncbi:MAG TPA: YcxB family protein [Fimbriiglobus sp.]|nr:YcxB family protein [Fimbriiglobus sp.]